MRRMNHIPAFTGKFVGGVEGRPCSRLFDDPSAEPFANSFSLSFFTIAAFSSSSCSLMGVLFCSDRVAVVDAVAGRDGSIASEISFGIDRLVGVDVVGVGAPEPLPDAASLFFFFCVRLRGRAGTIGLVALRELVFCDGAMMSHVRMAAGQRRGEKKIGRGKRRQRPFFLFFLFARAPQQN